MDVKPQRVEILDHGFIEVQSILGDDMAIVSAARTSYLGESKGAAQDKKLLFYLMKHEHASPFEFGMFRVRVRAPLFVARQWMRHRAFSVNETSRRYTSEELLFHTPTIWRMQDGQNKQASGPETLDESLATMFTGALAHRVALALDLYHHLVDNGVAREQARMVLPQNMYTTYVWGGDIRNLMHFIRLRIDKHAQQEIRLYAHALLNTVLKEYFPWTYEAFCEYQLTSVQWDDLHAD